jgi:hypothetical protein
MNKCALLYILSTVRIEIIPAISCKNTNSNPLGMIKPIIRIVIRCTNKATLLSKNALRIMGEIQKGIK